ncbi:hypothetical protein ACSX1C_00695 [Pseudomonas sp. MBLB4123]|uniref:hypothetical protein n=1 Tax=Pseudomonas sp. MBLB4123 TaxID=3451557 RepID=UPI003F74AE3B
MPHSPPRPAPAERCRRRAARRKYAVIWTSNCCSAACCPDHWQHRPGTAPTASRRRPPDGIEPAPEQGQFIARLQLELGEHLQAHPERVEPLGLAMLADACEAFSRVMPAAQLPPLPAYSP